MKKLSTLLLVLATTAMALTFAPAVSAHNAAQITLPTGVCMTVASEKNVFLGDGSKLDLRPETVPDGEVGTSYAADEGNTPLTKAPCP